MIWAFSQQNSSSGVNEQCIAGNAGAEWRCMFAEHTSPFIRTPTFPLQSVYDSWQVRKGCGVVTIIIIIPGAHACLHACTLPRTCSYTEILEILCLFLKSVTLPR